MGLLLDAIARSDGTRASVVDQLVHGRAVGTPLGSFAFDANGDPTLAPVTVTKISKSAGATPHVDPAGLAFVRVVNADPGIVAP